MDTNKHESKEFIRVRSCEFVGRLSLLRSFAFIGG